MRIVSLFIVLAAPAAAFVAPRAFASRTRAAVARAPNMAFAMEQLISESKDARLTHLEDQAMGALKLAVENFENPVFPNAMIAGDSVITHLLHRLGYLSSGKVKVMVVDTYHLFPETMSFLSTLEKEYSFKADVFAAVGCATKDDYDKKFGANLWKEDIEQYDKVCKVEPFQRGLKTCKTDVMINGRTRWQGFERAYIDLYENAPIGGGLAKVNPIAYWTFEDTFDYIAKYKISAHPLHAYGYPSLGDAKDTIPIPKDGSTKFANFKFEGDKKPWLDYASERKGRFVGLANKDGSTKTECGIHVAGAEKTFDRDLWDAKGSKVVELSKDAMAALKAGGATATVQVIYAPWCKFCKAMEGEYEKLAKTIGEGVTVAKYRGDEDRDFVQDEFGVKSFPTINVITKEGKVVKYDSEIRDVRALTEFVSKTIA